MLPIEPRLLTCFQMVFPNLSEAQILAASTDTVPAWDSMATVKLFSLVEEEFGVAPDFEYLDEMTSFTRFAERLREQIG